MLNSSQAETSVEIRLSTIPQNLYCSFTNFLIKASKTILEHYFSFCQRKQACFNWVFLLHVHSLLEIKLILGIFGHTCYFLLRNTPPVYWAGVIARLSWGQWAAGIRVKAKCHQLLLLDNSLKRPFIYLFFKMKSPSKDSSIKYSLITGLKLLSNSAISALFRAIFNTQSQKGFIDGQCGENSCWLKFSRSCFCY